MLAAEFLTVEDEDEEADNDFNKEIYLNLLLKNKADDESYNNRTYYKLYIANLRYYS